MWRYEEISNLGKQGYFSNTNALYIKKGPLIRAFSEQLGGGAPDHFGMPGGGHPAPPPSFCASGAGSLTSPALIETPWHAYSTIWYTLVVQLRTKFKTIQLCSLLMCIET